MAKSAKAQSKGHALAASASMHRRGTPPKAIPVTLLSGFLGSGKTTLLQHVLRSEHGLRIAVIVNDIGAINVDASLIKQTHKLTRTEEKVVSLQNGCICCTLRGDLLEELVRLAELQQFDYIIIESSGISEPEQVAETFDARLAEQMEDIGAAAEGFDKSVLEALERIKKAGGLEKFARLDTTCTVVDCFTLFNDFETADLLSSRRDDVVPEDERTVSDLMVDQLEFADVVVLNKIEMIDVPTRERILDLVHKLNHRAKVLQTSYSKIDVKEIVNTGMFNLERAQTGYGWLQDLHAMTLREVNGRKTVTPKPETEEYNVRNFVYSRRRPFHPLRLYKLVYDKFILQLEHSDEEYEDDDESMTDLDDSDSEDEDMADASSLSEATTPSETSTHAKAVAGRMSHQDSATGAHETPPAPENREILANKRASPLFSRLFRSKGEFWLATRPQRAGEWSQAGAMLSLTGGRPWFCTLPESEYITGSTEIDELVQHDIQKGGEWGDRHQEIVFIGEKLDITGLETELDQCLLTDDEFAEWCKVMRGRGQLPKKLDRLADTFDDGFPDWPEDEEDDAHIGHDHTHGHGHQIKHVVGKSSK